MSAGIPNGPAVWRDVGGRLKRHHSRVITGVCHVERATSADHLPHEAKARDSDYLSRECLSRTEAWSWAATAGLTSPQRAAASSKSRARCSKSRAVRRREQLQSSGLAPAPASTFTRLHSLVCIHAHQQPYYIMIGLYI